MQPPEPRGAPPPPSDAAAPPLHRQSVLTVNSFDWAMLARTVQRAPPFLKMLLGGTAPPADAPSYLAGLSAAERAEAVRERVAAAVTMAAGRELLEHEGLMDAGLDRRGPSHRPSERFEHASECLY